MTGMESDLFCDVLGHCKRPEKAAVVENSSGGVHDAGAWQTSTSADASIMDPPVYYSKAEFIETVRLLTLLVTNTYHLQNRPGYRQ